MSRAAGLLSVVMTAELVIGCVSVPRSIAEGGASNAAGGSSSSGGAAGVCDSLSQAACEASSDCVPLFGRKGTLGKPLRDTESSSRSYQGCRHDFYDGLGCGAAVTCGYDPNGVDCWVFPDTCIPAGWTVLNCAEECPLTGFGGSSGAGGGGP
jgi:hypothetical protein